MSDDPEIERALADVTAKQDALEAQLQRLREAEAAAIAALRARADTHDARVTALERERLVLVQRAADMNSKRRVVLGFARQSARLVHQVINGALIASLMLGFLALSTVEHLSGWLVFGVTVAIGVVAAFLGDAAEHSELQ